ncbi:MAG: VOC family protein [Phycisphaerales bacterium]
MADPFAPRVGGVMSADIAVPEHDRVVRFYARVLTTGERPLWRDDLMNSRGVPVIGIGAQSPAYAELPMQWMPHIQVADVAQSAARAVALGGRELMHGKDDSGASQWAVLLDPSGAGFGLIPVVTPDQIPAGEGDPSASTGCIAWLDLTVPDASAMRDFYCEVIGWSAQDAALEDGGERYADYCMHGADGHPAAGICHARGVNAGLPPVWLLYLPVGDLDESLRRVQAEGGSIIKAPPTGAGATAVIRDPAGVCVALARG